MFSAQFENIPLAELNAKGIFPAPGQKDPLFWKKVDLLLHPDPSMSEQEGSYLGHFNHPFLEKLDIDPSWIFWKRSNQNLRFWEGACLWQKEAEGFTIPIIQVAKRIGRFYSQEELIMHEIVHAVRSDFLEERFEEMLAYATSTKGWRALLGPLFRNPKEVAIFIAALILTFILQMLEMATFLTQGWLLLPWVLIFPFFIGGLRLKRERSIFKRCLKNLSKIVVTPGKELAVALRLSDSEILLFSQLTKEEALLFIEEKKEKSLRWKMIASSYFF